MRGFIGFGPGKQPYTPLPNLFFSELLPDIDDLAELKVTLYVFWLLAQKKREQPCVGEAELASDGRLVDGLSSAGLSGEAALRSALERAVARGTLLHVTSGEGPAERHFYFVNSEKGRQSMQELVSGKWTPADQGEPLHLQSQRPNIFVLYEQNIGPLTPLLAEQLMDAESTYPSTWIEDAFREAVELNKRSWRYVQRILERWSAEGRSDETTRRSDDGSAGRRRFIEGKYADYIEH